MNLYEKLNRLDDSLVESKRIFKKKMLTESYSNEMTEFMSWVQEYRDGALWDDFAAEFESEQDPDISVVLTWLENFDEDAYYDYIQIDDDIDEMLTESAEQYELSTLVKDSINHLVNDLGKDPMADDFGDDVCKDLENNYNIDIPQDMVRYSDWCYAVMSEVSRQVNKVEDELKENLKNPYFTPYGYKDAAKVLNGKAPEYYYHLKEIEMDRGDGVKLAKYALKKGLPVMIEANSDPDYPTFAIKGEYHWNDYFYPCPTAHEEDLVAWDGKMFIEEQLTEGRDNTALELIANQIVEYAKEHPSTLKNFKYMYDYIDNLRQEGRFEIPSKVGQFVVEDPENVTEEETETFINMLLDETDVGGRLIEVKRAAQKSAWSELRNRFPSI